MAYEPFGDNLGSTGVANSVFGFTGEWTDSYIKLIYLRSRYYAPESGRFITKDVWTGDYTTPMSYNNWLYAYANPINLIDPSGLKPNGPSDIGDIRYDKAVPRFQYSCNCGWIDWAHAISGMRNRTSLAHQIYSGIGAYVDWNSYENWTGHRGVSVQSAAGTQRFAVTILSEIAVIREDSIKDNYVGIAAGIFMEHSMKVEDIHGFLRIGRSHYAEEDLPSNLIGFYVATAMVEHNLDVDTLIGDIDRLCGLLSTEDSTSVYKNEYQNGAGFEENWRNWQARLVPLTSSRCVTCIPPRRWPSQFSTIAMRSISSGRNNSWWWYHLWLDGALRATDQEGVYAIENK
jgi:RHS repeat-associated protein